MSSTAMPWRSRSRSSTSRICACTVTSSAVVGSSATRISGSADERDRDHHPLAHAAAQLVGIGVEPGAGIGDAHLLEQRAARARRASRAGHVEVRPHAFGDLVADGEHRVEAGHRVLEDHADPAAPDPAERLALEREHVGVAQPDRAAGLDPARRRHQPEQREAGEALPAARFADQRERLAPVEREADPVHRIDSTAVAASGKETRRFSTSRTRVMRLGDRRRRAARRRTGWRTAR